MHYDVISTVAPGPISIIALQNNKAIESSLGRFSKSFATYIRRYGIDGVAWLIRREVSESPYFKVSLRLYFILLVYFASTGISASGVCSMFIQLRITRNKLSPKILGIVLAPWLHISTSSGAFLIGI